ncbi:MAG: pilus assembly protein CpaF [Candidatus Sedimenticola endophacoides]|uniref:Pilus assembly protein CpaF n=1 Tax=Candidatus Sedimenticola endophacoides TaxID=2548426 RepID=A0A657Q0I5_9GAMM|nr:MAG: pilus assembly protein CpaF [Candidatus Sedimenticola endophacoides]OQX40148.1 MAG: pilus assembly protein CpaF [Candidatus Sedimenticola endophacoides]OQX40543.1 MAG: pilus assembly protein CpaF [Candidatus Sedimenticola endophacoides]OQX44761.1 MAG: pilus assembly protein CpaF [Candidatus Sedimenticola endophacoides]OQX46404.1 MAG: pilus assembly protein CpaF [Candidatus Sedimenticola endophacoides]
MEVRNKTLLDQWSSESALTKNGDSKSEEMQRLKNRIHRRLLDRLNLSIIDQLDPLIVRNEIGSLVRTILEEESIPLNAEERNLLVTAIQDEVLGLGPLEPLLADHTVSDILVNTYSQVYVERAGRLEKTEVAFQNDDHLLRIIDKIASSVGRRIDESSPMVDARLADGSRVNAIIPPLAIDGPCLSIRKFSIDPYTINDLIEFKSITPVIRDFLQAAVKSRVNILLSGGTGGGKTTLLNAMSGSIPDTERIITIEDSAELQLQQPHTLRLETRPPNIEGAGEITARDLVRNALRMRPDRIIVGEVRGSEALDMLQAMNTGHDGSLSTIHANSPRDALTRLEHMVGMSASHIPAQVSRQQIAAALHLVIQVERLIDGRRVVTSVQEITGMEEQVVSMQEIFYFERSGINSEGQAQGQFRATGIRPSILRRFRERGYDVPDSLFEREKIFQ